MSREETLWNLLEENGAIEHVTTLMFRGIPHHPRDVSRKRIGHWWMKIFNENYADRKGQGYGTCVVGRPKRKMSFTFAKDGSVRSSTTAGLLIVRFQQVFECGKGAKRVSYTGAATKYPIAQPVLRELYRPYGDLLFLQELQRLEMLADDNLMTDSFRMHTGSLTLHGHRIDGIGDVCSGMDPTLRTDDEYWILNPAQSMLLTKKRYWGNGGVGLWADEGFVTGAWDASESDHDTASESDASESDPSERPLKRPKRVRLRI